MIASSGPGMMPAERVAVAYAGFWRRAAAYLIDLATGTPSAAVNVTGSSINSTDTNPISIVVDPALGRYVYTANFLGDSISGFRINPNAGSLSQAQATPYPTGQKPTAITCIPHGNHAVQSVTP